MAKGEYLDPEYRQKYSQKYKRTEEGWITLTYRKIVTLSRYKKDGDPSFSYDEFKGWLRDNYRIYFKNTFDKWVESDCKRELLPVIIRKNAEGGFTLNNLSLVVRGSDEYRRYRKPQQPLAHIDLSAYTGQIFRDVVGYEGYYKVSDKGVVISLYSGKELKHHLNNKGYYNVRFCVKGKCTKEFLHRIIAEAFLEHEPSKNVVNHIDSNHQNNNLENLEWCTTLENVRHAIKQGRAFLKKGMAGEHSIGHKLNNDAVKTIRQLAEDGLTYREIAKRYNVTGSNIASIVKRETWKHI